MKYFNKFLVSWPSWLRHRANNAGISGSIPLETISFVQISSTTAKTVSKKYETPTMYFFFALYCSIDTKNPYKINIYMFAAMRMEKKLKKLTYNLNNGHFFGFC